mmetsp:Transcript_7712/g.23344  ORF Transcript_7712/g.23344 Transcript_7712/m.23344 type:complete len:340 (-) Transcript_7712:152-1171(-)
MAFVSSVSVLGSSKTGTTCSRVHGFFQRQQVDSAPVAAKSRVTMKAVDKSKVPLNLYRPNNPYEATVLFNQKIVGNEAPGETMHMAFNHDGNLQYLEGQSIGVIPPGTDKKGKPHKVRLYSIASTQHGDFGDDMTISLCVKRLVYNDSDGNEVKGVCSNFLCDLKPGEKVSISGPVGTAMLMPEDPNANIIMLGTGTGVAPFRAFIRRAFAEKNPDYKFKGLMWLFLGVPTSSTLLYKAEFEELAKQYPDNFRVDYAISREQTDSEGRKMYLQYRMADYAEQLKNMFQQENTYVYMCGLKGMEPGIDDLMTDLFAKEGIDWTSYRKQMKKEKRWEVETY